MNPVNYALLLAAFLAASGCAHTVDFKDPSAISKAFLVKRDSHDQTTNSTGPNYRSGHNTISMSSHLNDRIGITVNKISVNSYYHGDRCNYDKAYDTEGNRLDFVSILKKVDYCDNSGCWNNESFDITVPREYLLKNLDKGFTFKASGAANCSQSFTVPPAYLKGYLAVVK